ncbi:hypothetical protein [Myroides guanonis]|uniref:hypothetical protein n=1 Tax=Myroides guanonis TaxID=1150112 RepID=UPI0015A5699B|nr:hypothetical protein [Myroides guanonis]
MTYSIYSDLGGFLWWIFVRFCKTDLKEEQSKNYWARNIFVLIMVFIGLTGVSVVFF